MSLGKRKKPPQSLDLQNSKTALYCSAFCTKGGRIDRFTLFLGHTKIAVLEVLLVIVVVLLSLMRGIVGMRV